MNWSAISWDAVLAIAQIVGDAGVFLSLVYVALQIRSDARARRADTMYRQSHAFMTSLHSLAFDSEFSDIFLRWGKKPGVSQ